MTTAQTNILMPDADTPRLQQYEYAWRTLLHDETASPDQKAHAKCWLTYRAIDNEVTFEDWAAQVAPVDTHDRSLRWIVSQSMAEAYLYLLATHDFQQFRSRLWRVLHEVETSKLTAHIGASLNYLRCSTLAAYDSLLQAQHDTTRSIINAGIVHWQQAHAVFDAKTYPFRFLEMRGDTVALHAMMQMLQRIGDIGDENRLHANWCEEIMAGEKQLPWWRCMHILAEGCEDALWSDSRYPHKTESDISTRYDLARQLFDGVGAELGVAAGVFSKTILGNENVTLLYSIDRWSDHHDFKEYRRVLGDLAEFEDRSIVLRASFDEALTIFPDDYLHWIYIDGYAHTGQENGKTLDDWYPKLQPGGIFAGHDYSTKYPQTVEAVDAFMRKHDLPLYLTTGDTHQSWWTRKPI